jgi:L-ascorbate metabolism protein UlaG (beta-lactamase superfamily)
MIEPELKYEAFLEDVQRARRERDRLHVWWLGQSGFLIHWGNSCLLVDPYLSDSLTKKYESTDKPHVRMTARVIAPEKLDFIDVVTSSHNHTDHLDAETLLPLRQANPGLQMIIPEANRSFVADRLNADAAWPIGLDDGTPTSVAGFEFVGVPAAHETVERDEAGRCKFLGYIIGVGGLRIYHSGDTVGYEDLAARLRLFQVDVALLPINGANPERRVAGNLSGIEAARLARDAGARLVVPCHYDMFEFNTASPAEFIAEAERLHQPYRTLRCGQRLDVMPQS